MYINQHICICICISDTIYIYMYVDTHMYMYTMHAKRLPYQCMYLCEGLGACQYSNLPASMLILLLGSPLLL